MDELVYCRATGSICRPFLVRCRGHVISGDMLGMKSCWYDAIAMLKALHTVFTKDTRDKNVFNVRSSCRS